MSFIRNTIDSLEGAGAVGKAVLAASTKEDAQAAIGLDAAISSEANARIQADNALSERIDNLEDAVANGFDYVVETVGDLPSTANSSGRIETARVVNDDQDPDNNGAYWRDVGETSWTKIPGDISGKISNLETNKADKDLSNVPDGSVDGRLLGIGDNELVAIADQESEWDSGRMDADGKLLWGVKRADLGGGLHVRSLGIGDNELAAIADREIEWDSGRVDADGMLLWGVKRADLGGGLHVRSLESPVVRAGEVALPGEIALIEGNAEWSYAEIDPAGYVKWGIDFLGRKWPRESSSGGGTTPDPEDTVTVHRAYVEVRTDPSKDAFITWHSSSSSGKVLEYRLQGATNWAAVSGWSRPFPHRSETIHTVELTDLSADAVYEFRVPGSSTIRKFKTCPRYLDGGELKAVWLSDWQPSNFTTDTSLGLLGGQTRAVAPDLLLLGGDYVNDDGSTSETLSNRWVILLNALEQQYAPDGILRPIAALAGNHEIGGSGYPRPDQGYMPTLFTWAFNLQRSPNCGGQGYAYFRVGSELLYVGIDTGLYSLVEGAQETWMKGVLAEYAAEVRHVVTAGHVAPFPTGRAYNGAWERQGRNFWWPNFQDLPNCKFVLTGHAHVVHVTPPLKFDYDSGAAAADNDFNFYGDVDGLVQVGTGPWGAALRSLQNDDVVSGIDGVTTLIEAGLYSGGPVGSLTNPDTTNGQHLWAVTITEAEITAECINRVGVSFYEQTISL